jgi:threonine dehydratase
MTIPDFKNVTAAHDLIRGHIHRTPVLTSSAIDEIAGCRIFFKCENFQKTGSFKFRGATNAVLSLPSKGSQNGVATHSSGNHAAALALAAKKQGLKCHIVMPHLSAVIKITAVKTYGGIITFCDNNLASREETLARVVASTGAAFVHAYDNFNVICGQATSAKELLEDCPGLDALFVPVGGGGILSGSSIAARALSPGIDVYGCEPLNADDARRSFLSGSIQPPLKGTTIADGLRTSLSDLTYAIIMKNVTDILTVTETEIIQAMKLIWERMKIVTEPSSAVALAAILKNTGIIRGKKAGIILTGGNVDLLNLPFAL